MTMKRVRMTESEKRKTAVVEALTKAYNERDFSVLEAWWSAEYIQHNPFIPAKRAGLRDFVESQPRERRYEHGRVFADADFVIVHGRYIGGGKKTLVAVDLFRFEDDKVVEHWDVLQEEVPLAETKAGHAMFTKD
jgi:predicted SnoaL-like aldol condensation-catalyzing enzyme